MSGGDTTTWLSVLTEIFRRNGGVEVSGVSLSKDDRINPSFRTRVLDLAGKFMVIERPQSPEAAHYLRRGAEIRVLAAEGQNRWEMTTTVVEPMLFQLNATLRVAAFRLEMPQGGKRSQRRDFFRASTDGANLQPALLTPIEPETDAAPAQASAVKLNDSAPVETAVAEPNNETPADSNAPAAPDPHAPIAIFAKVVNISGGGLGVEVPLRASLQLRRIRLFLCRLELPLEGTIEVRARVVHLTKLENSSHYVGMRFEFDKTQEARRFSDTICRFTAWHQRQQLQQRTRGA